MIRARRPVLLLTLLIWVLLHDSSGFARMALLASLLHESGHVVVYRALLGRWPLLHLSAFGIGLTVGEAALTPRQEFWLAAAGPLTNLLLCGGLLAAMQLRACLWGYFFAGANLCAGLFNLLPVGCLDGHRMLRALCRGRKRKKSAQ